MEFETAFNRLMGSEGGYTDGKGDPGGETKWGISKRSYPHLDIRKLTREDAKAIYQRDFWERIHGHVMTDGIAFQVFDFAVNSGIETAIRSLQRAVGVADDGVWGPVSYAAMIAMSDSDLVMHILAQRIRFMTKLSNWPTAGRGWMNRIANNLDYGAVDS